MMNHPYRSNCPTAVCLLLLAVLLCGGCGSRLVSDAEAQKAFGRAPKNLLQLSQRIRSEMQKTRDGESSPKSILAIEHWVTLAPEYAADTDMPEDQWGKIQSTCASLQQSLAGNPSQLSQQQWQQLTQLCHESQQAWETLPKHRQLDRHLLERHSHSHDNHGHSNGDHGHSHDDHDHSHGDHDHSHDDRGHSH
ncbi:MAG: hypothetical protein AAFP90_15575 [Planctomycetota bacterium]